MKCPLCNLECRIISSKYVLEGTRLYIKQGMTCMNKNCNNFQKEVNTAKNELPVEINEETE